MAQPTNSRISLAKEPGFFDRTPSHFEAWFDSLATYVGAYRRHFVDDSDRVYFTLSLLRDEKQSECTSHLWAKKWKEVHLDAGGDLAIRPDSETIQQPGGRPTTYQDLVKDLIAQFRDPQLKNKAIQRLTTYRQLNNQSAANYFQQFEVYRSEAGYGNDIHDEWTIQQLLCLIKREYIEKYLDGSTTTDYPSFKQRILEIEQAALLKQRLFSSYTASTTPPTKTPSSSSSQAWTAPPGTQGAPMNIDKVQAPFACYHCGQAGHMGRNCTNDCYNCHEKHPGKRCQGGTPYRRGNSPGQKKRFNRRFFTEQLDSTLR